MISVLIGGGRLKNRTVRIQGIGRSHSQPWWHMCFAVKEKGLRLSIYDLGKEMSVMGKSGTIDPTISWEDLYTS